MKRALYSALFLTALLPLSPPSMAYELSGPADDMQRLKGDALWDAFSGKTLLGVYRDERQKGGTQHFTEYHAPNGTTDYREGDIKGPGRWAILQDRICFAYKDILSPGPHCFVIIKSGTCLFNYSPRNIKNDLPVTSDKWMSKAVHKGEVSTCDDPVS